MGYIKQVPLKINPFHFCILPLYLTTGIGTVWQCDLCGKIWERVNGTPAWTEREAEPEAARGPQGIPAPTAAAVDAFKRAWHDADTKGLAGARVEAGLIAALQEMFGSAAPEESDAAIARVRALHKQDAVLADYCEECSDFGTDQYPPGQMVEWPCPTIRALEPLPVGGEAE